MPKRSAEKELNKDNADFEDADETPSIGFVKAKDEELSKRRIVGLPKRAQSASKITTPLFGGFSAPSNPMATPGGSAPTVAPTATSTAKNFASFLQPASASPSPASSQPSVTPPSFGKPAQEDDSSLNKYYLSLRGLNVSLLEALTKTTEDNPFADISGFLERYKNMRLDVQKEFEDNKKSTLPVAKPPVVATAPAPPSGGFKGFSFGPTSSTSLEPSNTSGGFKPQPTAPSTTSGFSFSIPPTNSSAANPFAISSTSTSSPLFKPSTASSSSPFAAPEKPSSESSSLASKSSAAVDKDKNVPSSSSFTFGSSISSDANTSFPFSSLGSSTSTSEKGSSSSFSFGKPSSSTFSFGATGGSTSTPFGSSSAISAFGKTSPSSNIFGSTDSEASTPKAPLFGTFGKPTGSGSIGNPVGFGFGAPVTPDTPATPESSSYNKESQEGSQDTQDGGASVAEGSSGLITKNPHDEEGEGEEEENTLHEVRLKVYRLENSDSGSSWADLGVGILRIKKHKTTGARRVLLRNSGTGRLILNFKLYSGLKLTQNKKSLTFVGHDDKGVSQTYNVRLQGEELAKTLRETLEREVAELE